METISLFAELGEIRYAIEGAHWIADSVAMGAVPDPEQTHSAPVIISAILLLVENRLHQLGRVLRGRLTGALHILRHTFCSRLAMRGAPAKAIQELAGHESLTTTQRYMHLSPAAKDAAISLLDTAGPQLSRDMLETGSATQGKTGG
jgi:hypothetical protein